jgi:hypothetical protein
VIGQEFGRRIARTLVRLHLEEFLQGRNRASRSLSYGIYSISYWTILQRKVDHFFVRPKEEQLLSQEDERMLKEQFNCMKHEYSSKGGGSNLIKILGQLERADWML